MKKVQNTDVCISEHVPRGNKALICNCTQADIPPGSNKTKHFVIHVV